MYDGRILVVVGLLFLMCSTKAYDPT